MKKILMLVMMVVTMGLVGCGEMTAEEMEREIVSIAEENGYEMIIIKKNDTEVESATYSVREEVEETPVPTRITTPTPVPTEKVTPTPFPTPTGVPTEESEDANVAEYVVNPNTGEKIETTPTPEPTPTTAIKEPKETKYAKIVTGIRPGTQHSDNPEYYVYFLVNTKAGEIRTKSKPITTEEYNEFSQKTVALVEIEVLPDWFYDSVDPLYEIWLYSYEIVE